MIIVLVTVKHFANNLKLDLNSIIFGRNNENLFSKNGLTIVLKSVSKIIVNYEENYCKFRSLF